jgi:galactokinase
MEQFAGPDAAASGRRIAAFRATFGADPSVLVWAPGRINLIGEHIDYCGGTVLPFAIQAGTWVAAGAAPDGLLQAASSQYAETGEAALGSPGADWLRYPCGVWRELAHIAGDSDDAALSRGHALDVHGGLMAFGGLSSSASLCLAIAMALAARMHRPIGDDPLALAQLCRTVEHRHLGVSCGIMDQAVIALSRPGCALALRCNSLQYDHVPLPLAEHAILAVHSGVPRALAGSPYNERQRQVRAAEAVLRQRMGLTDACSLAPERLREVEGWMAPAVFARLRHVVGEQARVQQAITALRAGDLPRFGLCMSASHASLRDDFEVSCAELDLIHDRSLAAGALGARLTGAGFGGVAIVLAERHRLAAIAAEVAAAFVDAGRPEPRMFVAAPAGAARVVWRSDLASHG